ncbi:TPA: hypothetical protein NHO66_004169, partial [Pseudomonas aeruginosa]|nr:hypothetical protein [Pseudomonas aeruginosa]EMB3070103.1 hypothetical protein [Pseudomonas aeruginosa]MBH8680157.1 hypothetical protein [Pseudomonas aeruginosa]MBH8925755.1 hypothetical protein [Pseudomonas aeruginosa]MBI8264484.1 hypothetical protein [Pseudomonas aeruginosa]
MSVKISFDDEIAVASILLADWAPALVECLGRYFDVREGMLRLDYTHLPAERVSVGFDFISDHLTVRERFVYEFRSAAEQGPIALTLTMLGHGSIGISGSSSILDQDACRSAVGDFRNDVLQGDSRALREAILAEIAPRATWLSWLLDADPHSFLGDGEIMAALVASTSKGDWIDCLRLVAPHHGHNNWAFEQTVEQHWQDVCVYLDTHIGGSPGYSRCKVPGLVFSLFANSPKVQESRWACEQVLKRADPTVFPQLIQHCRAIEADDVRSLFLCWHNRQKTEKKDDFKECVAKACSVLASVFADAVPSDLALASTWHEFAEPARSDQQSVAASLRELPSGAWDRQVLWSQLGPSAREAWRQ